MNRKQKNRLLAIVSILLVISFALGLILYALKQNINLFYTPTQLLQSSIKLNQIVRIGGYVKEGSVQFDASGTSVTFKVTDKVNTILVHYHGVLPNLFREGQTVVVTGKWDSENLQADQVLAKHDEKYMPKFLEKELKRGEKNAS